MANLSPSSSCSSRRLSELLEEQQEPFFLDLHLLDKGCSPVLVDASGAGAGSACWPRSRSTSLALRRMAASKETRASGILGFLVSKILRSTTAATGKRKKKKLQQPAAAIDWGTVDGRTTPVNLKIVDPSRLPGAVEADMEEAEVVVEEEDNDDSSKQLSPVSVLEHRFFQQAPPSFPQKAVVIFRELLESAYTPTLLDQLTKAKEISSRIDTSAATTSAPAPAPARADRTADCEDMCEAELAKVHDLVASDVAAGAKLGLSEARRDVGVEIATALLEALTEEIAVELKGMDHDDAIDMLSRRRCWC